MVRHQGHESNESYDLMVEMIYIDLHAEVGKKVLSRSIVLGGTPRKGERFSVTNELGKGVFEIDEVEWRLAANPICYLKGLGVASTSFGAEVLKKGGWVEKSLGFFSETAPQLVRRKDIDLLISKLSAARLKPTKQDHLSFNRLVAVWHVDNDNERWVRLETLLRTPGFLLSFFDSFCRVSNGTFFTTDVEIAVEWIKSNVTEMGKHRSPWNGP